MQLRLSLLPRLSPRSVYTVEPDILAGIIFGRLVENCNWRLRYDRHAFSWSLCNIGGFNIGGVTRNPPNIIPRQYFQLYGSIDLYKCQYATRRESGNEAS